MSETLRDEARKTCDKVDSGINRARYEHYTASDSGREPSNCHLNFAEPRKRVFCVLSDEC